MIGQMILGKIICYYVKVESLKPVNAMRSEWKEWHHETKRKDVAIIPLYKNGSCFT